ncbi:MAG: phosphatidylinositol mannoside acyltransferase [Actinomycetia bacterium]|nr:phosphatidylinositol mannoside acyltransferase [Actinomycetes bacterium]
MKIVYYAFIAAGWVIGKVPIRITRGFAKFGGLAYYYMFPRKRRLVLKNMRRALGPGASDRQVRDTAKRACRYYADYWVDIFWLPTLPREYVLERLEKINWEPLERVVNEGKGVLIVLPHYGSWEAGAVYLANLGHFAAVAEILKPRELFDLFCRLREGIGIEIFPYDKKAETRDRMVDALKGGTILALICDRDLKGGGVEVEFFGERTTLPPGPASLALRSGSPIVCVSTRNLPDGTWVGRVTEPIYLDGSGDKEAVIQETMQEVARRLEELIREDPAQWHMFMPAWPSDRE